MDPTELNDLYLQNLLNTLAFENKDLFLMGEFNINNLQYDGNEEFPEFLDKMHFFCHICFYNSSAKTTFFCHIFYHLLESLLILKT